MSAYQAYLLTGVALLLFGGIQYVRGMIEGQARPFYLLVTLAGGAALVAAEGASPKGASVAEIVPAIQDLFVEIDRLIF